MSTCKIISASSVLRDGTASSKSRRHFFRFPKFSGPHAVVPAGNDGSDHKTCDADYQTRALAGIDQRRGTDSVTLSLTHRQAQPANACSARGMENAQSVLVDSVVF